MPTDFCQQYQFHSESIIDDEKVALEKELVRMLKLEDPSDHNNWEPPEANVNGYANGYEIRSENVESTRNEPAGISDLPLSLLSGMEEKLRAMVAELYHAKKEFMSQPLQYIFWVLKDGGKESLSRVLKDPFAKEAVDLLSKLGYPELIMRTDGIRVIQQNTPRYDSTSAGLVENAVKQVKEKVRVLVIRARELHGATIDRSHVTLPWYIRFAGQVLSRTVRGHDSTAELIVGTPTGCKICRLVKRRSKADAADPIFFNSVRGTPWCLVPVTQCRRSSNS